MWSRSKNTSNGSVILRYAANDPRLRLVALANVPMRRLVTIVFAYGHDVETKWLTVVAFACSDLFDMVR